MAAPTKKKQKKGGKLIKTVLWILLIGAIFNGISDYAYEFENYIYSSGDIDTFYDYYYQSCEVDSNSFADYCVEIYYDVLSGYFE